MNAMTEKKLTSEMCTWDGNCLIERNIAFLLCANGFVSYFFRFRFGEWSLSKDSAKVPVCIVIGDLSSLFAQSIVRIKSVSHTIYAMPLPTHQVYFTIPNKSIHSHFPLQSIYLRDCPTSIRVPRRCCMHFVCRSCVRAISCITNFEHTLCVCVCVNVLSVRFSVCFSFIRNRIVFPCIQRTAPSTTKSTTTIDATISVKRIEPKRTESQCDNVGSAYPHRHSISTGSGKCCFRMMHRAFERNSL